MSRATWIVVLIKDFHTAKSRLAPALAPSNRRALAEANAARALDAALDVAATIAVCGSADAAALARVMGAVVVSEPVPGGQNAAATLGLAEVTARGGEAALLLSSDLPLVTASGLQRLLRRAAAESGALALAVPALGRHGTNALFLRPPGEFDLQFGDASLPRFAEEARHRRRTFVIHQEASLALDLDEPSDLAVWAKLQKSA
ncbi:MAG: 2-phospho-L-lactate guanylyltransferase [Candidatus Dormibacteria bacterium]